MSRLTSSVSWRFLQPRPCPASCSSFVSTMLSVLRPLRTREGLWWPTAAANLRASWRRVADPVTRTSRETQRQVARSEGKVARGSGSISYPSISPFDASSIRALFTPVSTPSRLTYTIQARCFTCLRLFIALHTPTPPYRERPWLETYHGRKW